MADPSQLSDKEILAKILSQPETTEIAKSLGMEVEDYAKRVLFYVRHPDQEPQVEVMSEEEAKKAGMPSAAECVTFLEGAVAEVDKEETAHYAGFDDDEKSAATATGSVGKKTAPKSGEARGDVVGDDDEARERVKKELADARKQFRSK